MTSLHDDDPETNPPITITTTPTLTPTPTPQELKEKENENAFQWTTETETLFFQSFMDHGSVLKPVGVGKHFAVLLAHNRFTELINRSRRARGKKEIVDLDVDLMWNKLESLYDLDLLELDEQGKTPFPNEIKEFELPESIFNQRKRRRRTSSEDNFNLVGESDDDDGESSSSKSHLDKKSRRKKL